MSAALLTPLSPCAIDTCSGHIEGTSGFLFDGGNNDLVAEFSFETTIAGLRTPQTDGDDEHDWAAQGYVPMPTGGQYDNVDENADNDGDAYAYTDVSGEGEAEQPVAATTQPAAPTLACAVCMTPLLAGENYRYCTGCDPQKYVHDDLGCLGNEKCYVCHTALVSPNAAATAAPVTWQTDVTSTLWDPNRVVPQGANATMCYAAATATAVRCADAGSAITVADCMHLYAVSGGTEGDWAGTYKRSFDEAEAVLKVGGDARPTVTAVHQKMGSDLTHPQWANDLRNTNRWGSPVFPGGIAVAGPYLLKLNDIIGYARAAKLILAGNSSHWYVIWGCKVRAGDGKAYLRIYDPMGTGQIEDDYLWTEGGFEQYLIVG